MELQMEQKTGGARGRVLLTLACATFVMLAALLAPARALAAEQRATLDSLPVTFSVEGRPNKDIDFAATLEAVDEGAPMPARGGEVVTVTGAGTGVFGPIQFTKPGAWVYKVNQTTKTDNSHWTLDDAVYYVQVVAEWKDDDHFVATAKAYTDPENPGNKDAKLEFANTYVADGKWLVDPGEKWYENGELKAGDFAFDIFRKEGESWVKVAETTNGAGVEKTADGKEYSVGTWAFEDIALTQPGEYEYKVLERLPEGATKENSYKLDGIAYDASEYFYDVKVEAVGDAYEATEVTARDADGNPVDVVKFTNSKDADKPKATPAKPKPSQPTVAGKPLAKTGDASWGLAVFSGILLAAGAAFVVVSLVLRRRNA